MYTRIEKLTTTGGDDDAAEKLRYLLACACVSLATFARCAESSAISSEDLLEPTSSY